MDSFYSTIKIGMSKLKYNSVFNHLFNIKFCKGCEINTIYDSHQPLLCISLACTNQVLEEKFKVSISNNNACTNTYTILKAPVSISGLVH